MGGNGIDCKPVSPYLKEEIESNDRCLGYGFLML